MSIDVLDTEEAGRRIVRGGMLRTASYAAGILVGLIATPLLTRHLGPHDFGRYNTVTAISFIAVGLTEAGLLAVGVRELSTRSPERRLSFMRDYLGMRIVLGSLAALAMVGFALAAGYPHAVVVGTVIGAGALVPAIVYDVSTVPLQVQLRLGWSAALDFVRQAVTTAAIVALVAAGASIYPFFAVPGAAMAVAAVCAYAVARADVPLRPRFHPRGWWALMRDALPFTVASAVAVVYFRVAVVLMSLLATAAQTGYFSLAFRIVEIVSGVPWLLVSASLPLLTRTASNDRARLSYALQRLLEAGAIMGVGAALIIGVGAPVGVDVIGGHGFDAAIDPLRVLGVALVGTFLVALWGQALLSVREHAALLGANLAALAIALALTAVLVPAHGAMGGAIATTTTELSLATLYGAVLFRRHADLRPSFRIVVPVLGAAALAALPALVLPALPAALAAGALYVGLLLVTGSIPAEVFQALRRAD
jgi:O-antigen/teichoic acid export membrane protein